MSNAFHLSQMREEEENTLLYILSVIHLYLQSDGQPYPHPSLNLSLSLSSSTTAQRQEMKEKQGKNTPKRALL